MTTSRNVDSLNFNILERDNGNVHRAAAKIIVSKSRAARGSVCNILLSDLLAIGKQSALGPVDYALRSCGDIVQHRERQSKVVLSEHVGT